MTNHTPETREARSFARRVAALAGAAALVVAAASSGAALAGEDGPTFRLALKDCRTSGEVKGAVRHYLSQAGYTPRRESLRAARVGAPEWNAGVWSVAVKFYLGTVSAKKGAVFVDCHARAVTASPGIETLTGLPAASAIQLTQFGF